MTASNEKGWILDLHHTCDEVLVLFAREAGCRAARDELTCRCWGALRVRLVRCGPRRGLGPWDLEDAQQQAFFWIQEAIGAFDLKRSSFQTFLDRILRLRLMDFCRSAHRRNRRFRLSGDQEGWPQSSLTNYTPGSPDRPRELSRHLAVLVAGLDHQACVLWDELCQGKRLRDLPQVLGVRYRTVKRRWRDLRDKLAMAFDAQAKRDPFYVPCPLFERRGE